MTRRERLERKIEKRRDWADKARARSEQASNTAHAIASGIPPGQPILVGHHSEKRHRRDLARIDSAMRKTIEQGELATHHARKADGLADQLETSIYSDDADAIEQLQARIAALEAERERIKRYNASCRAAAKRGDKLGDLSLLDDAGREDVRRCAIAGQLRAGGALPAYASAYLGKRIRDAADRIKAIAARQARAQRAEDAGGVMVERSGDFARVTFAEKPARAILDDLKSAGFWWSKGSWHGDTAKIPASVSDLVGGAESGVA